MFAALRPALPPKTNNAFNNPSYYEDGAAMIEFHRDGSTYSMTHAIPSSKSSFNPPLHLHPTQDEAFWIEKGEVTFFLPRHNNKALRQFNVSAETSSEEEREVFVPRGEYHNFANASPDTPLVMRVGFNDPDFDKDEKFFRNFFGYIDDCRKAQMQPSLFQLMRMLYDMEAPLALPVPGPNWLAGAVSRAFCFATGVVVGEWLLGYKSSYPEYYNAKASKM